VLVVTVAAMVTVAATATGEESTVGLAAAIETGRYTKDLATLTNATQTLSLEMIPPPVICHLRTTFSAAAAVVGSAARNGTGQCATGLEATLEMEMEMEMKVEMGLTLKLGLELEIGLELEMGLEMGHGLEIAMLVATGLRMRPAAWWLHHRPSSSSSILLGKVALACSGHTHEEHMTTACSSFLRMEHARGCIEFQTVIIASFIALFFRKRMFSIG
jgi:hypothetical protein